MAHISAYLFNNQQISYKEFTSVPWCKNAQLWFHKYHSKGRKTQALMEIKRRLAEEMTTGFSIAQICYGVCIAVQVI